MKNDIQTQGFGRRTRMGASSATREQIEGDVAFFEKYPQIGWNERHPPEPDFTEDLNEYYNQTISRPTSVPVVSEESYTQNIISKYEQKYQSMIDDLILMFNLDLSEEDKFTIETLSDLCEAQRILVWSMEYDDIALHQISLNSIGTLIAGVQKKYESEFWKLKCPDIANYEANMEKTNAEIDAMYKEMLSI